MEDGKEKIDYTHLSNDELIRTAKKLEELFDSDAKVDAICDALYDLHSAMAEKTPWPKSEMKESTRLLRREAKAVMREFERRWQEEKETYSDVEASMRKLTDVRDEDNHYVIELEVNRETGDFFYKWNRWGEKPKYYPYWKTDDETKGIPDEEMLRRNPFVWMSRQLQGKSYIMEDGVYDDEYEDIWEDD